MIPTTHVQRGPSQAARCASTEDHQPPSPPLFREHKTNVGGLPILAFHLRGFGGLELQLRLHSLK